MVHLNNVDAMKYMRLSKSRVEVEDIKQIMAKENDNKKTPLGTLELSYIISFPHSFSAELYTLFETCLKFLKWAKPGLFLFIFVVVKPWCGLVLGPPD